MHQSASFDTWTSIFLFAVAMGLFLFVILISNKNRKNLPIAFLVLSFSIILLQYVLFWTGYEHAFPYLVLLPPFCYYLTGPLLYLYILNLYKKNIRYYCILHFLPAIIILIPSIFILLKYAGWYSSNIPLLWLCQKHWFIVIHMSFYVVLITILIYKTKHLKTHFEKIRNKWATVLVGLYTIFVLSYISYYVLVNFSFFNNHWDYSISMMMSLSIYTIGFAIYKYPKIFDGELYANLFLSKVSNKEPEDSVLHTYFAHLTQHMRLEKPFLDNELRLVTLADYVDLSPHILSKVINQISGKNFNNFINEYRIEEAETLLKDEIETNIKTIYYDVGFNSKAVFYNAFRQKHNCTPIQYRNQMKHS